MPFEKGPPNLAKSCQQQMHWKLISALLGGEIDYQPTFSSSSNAVREQRTARQKKKGFQNLSWILGLN